MSDYQGDILHGRSVRETDHYSFQFWRVRAGTSTEKGSVLLRLVNFYFVLDVLVEGSLNVKRFSDCASWVIVSIYVKIKNDFEGEI